jgi:hypothetical protein
MPQPTMKECMLAVRGRVPRPDTVVSDDPGDAGREKRDNGKEGYPPRRRERHKHDPVASVVGWSRVTEVLDWVKRRLSLPMDPWFPTFPTSGPTRRGP